MTREDIEFEKLFDISYLQSFKVLFIIRNGVSTH